MSVEATITGNLGQDPETRFTPQGKQVTDLSIAATMTRLNRQTGEFEQQGDPLWIRCALWDHDAQTAETLTKGDRVTVTGTLIRRTYTRRDGTPGESLELAHPRFRGVIPRRQQPHNPNPAAHQTSGWGTPAPTGAAGPQPPANDPWGPSSEPAF